MSEIKTQSLDKTLILKNKEIDSLKAQNERLIEKLQEEVDKSTKEFIHKEIVHKEIIKVQHALREIYQQAQTKKSVFEKIFNKIDEYELRLQEQQKSGFTNYSQSIINAISNEVESLKLEIVKIQSKETSIEKILNEQNRQMKSTQLALAAILKKLMINPEPFIDSVNEIAEESVASSAQDSAAANESFFITDDDIEKIESVLKTEFNSNQDEVNLIFQMLAEKNEPARDIKDKS